MEANAGVKDGYSPSMESPLFDRVRAHTPSNVNRRIDERSLQNMTAHSQSPEAIECRLRALDHEWDIDRVIMANFSLVAFSAFLLAGVFRRRSLLALPAIQIPFLFWYAKEGWSPSLLLLRSLGLRTRQEIEAEKMGLRKAGARNYRGKANPLH